MLMLREKLGIEPKQPITREDLAGLILAKNVGDETAASCESPRARM